MAIEVKHGQSAGATAAAAFGGAQGAARSRAAFGGARAATQREAQKNSLAARAKESDLARQHQLSRDDLGRQQQLSRDELGHERGLERQQAAFGNQQQAAVDAFGRRKQERADMALELTAKQKADLKRLANNEAKMLASTDYTDAEKKELRRKFDAARAGIQPVPTLKKPTPAELYNRRHVKGANGQIIPIDKDGNPGQAIEPLAKPPSFSDRAAAYKNAVFAAGDRTGVEFEQFIERAMRRQLGDQGRRLPPGNQAHAAMRSAMDGVLGGGVEGQAMEEPLGAQGSLGGGAQQAFDAAVRASGGGQGAAFAQVTKGLGELKSGKVNKEFVDPSGVTNLPTAKFQLEEARKALAKIKKTGTLEKVARGVGDAVLDLNPLSPSPFGGAVDTHASRLEAAQGRVKELEKKEAELSRQSEKMEMARFALERTGRGGQ